MRRSATSSVATGRAVTAGAIEALLEHRDRGGREAHQRLDRSLPGPHARECDEPLDHVDLTAGRAVEGGGPAGGDPADRAPWPRSRRR